MGFEAGDVMQVRVLGPLEVIDGDRRAVDVGGPRQRRLLSALALSRGGPVSEDRLIAAVWDATVTYPRTRSGRSRPTSHG